MRTTSVLVAALVAASSVAGYETERRRIYFPRHVKRQFTNATITSLDTPIPSESEDASKSTKRQTDNILDSITDLPFPSVAVSSDTTDVKVTTVVVQSTIFVPPTPTPAKNAQNSTEPSASEDVTSPTATPDASASAAPSTPKSKEPESAEPSPPISQRPAPVPTSKAEEEGNKPGNSTVVTATTTAATTEESIVSVAPTTTTTTPTGITIAPTGIVSSTPAEQPSTTPIPTTAKNPLDPITSVLSDVVSVVTSVVADPLQNATIPTTAPTTILEPPTSTIVTIPTDVTGPVTGISTTVETPIPSETQVKPSDPVTTPPPVVSSTIIEPPPISNTTVPPPISDPPSSTIVTDPTSVTSGSTITSPPNPPISSSVKPGNSSTSANTNNDTSADVSTSDDGPGVTSIPHIGTTTNSQSWLPTTILVDPTSTTVSGGLAPTTATGIPTAYPKAITPDSGLRPMPQDTELIQIGLLEGYNYPFVVGNTRAAAQIFQLLPDALSYAGGFSSDKVQMRKLIPLDTSTSMGFITTLAIVTYPKGMIDALRLDIKMPASTLYNNPDQLVFNFTKQLNSAIDITIGSYPDDVTATGGGTDSPTSGPTNPNGDPFSNEGTGGKSSTQQGTTAGIVSGAVVVAAAYGAAMFIIARRYKRKKQAHRRTSSISGTSSDRSEMRESPRSSPALMGGALLSRDFTGYGGIAGGVAAGVAGGRDSHGSGSRNSRMNTSARTQYISAPVEAQNSLGWN
jgi:hypothetical protein